MGDGKVETGIFTYTVYMKKPTKINHRNIGKYTKLVPWMVIMGSHIFFWVGMNPFIYSTPIFGEDSHVETTNKTRCFVERLLTFVNVATFRRPAGDPPELGEIPAGGVCTLGCFPRALTQQHDI